MPDARTDILVIAAGLIAWIGLYTASAQGLLHISWVYSDGMLALLGVGIAYRLWRLIRRWSR